MYPITTLSHHQPVKRRGHLDVLSTRKAMQDIPDVEINSSDDAGPSSTTTEPRVGAKRTSDEIEPEEQPRKLTAQERMQLNLIANLPSMNRPLRDARGRRRSTCVSSEEIVEAGLSALIANHGSMSSDAAADGLIKDEPAAAAAAADPDPEESDKDDAKSDEAASSESSG